ncbi:hypothetical protein L1887_53410 [Cichorium endivia]|nr:hypothetical protein L1887_53410 [Cichorium endivia]
MLGRQGSDSSLTKKDAVESQTGCESSRGSGGSRAVFVPMLSHPVASCEVQNHTSGEKGCAMACGLSTSLSVDSNMTLRAARSSAIEAYDQRRSLESSGHFHRSALTHRVESRATLDHWFGASNLGSCD